MTIDGDQTHDAPHDAPHQPEELLKLKEFVETRGKNMAIAVGIVLVVAVAVTAVRSSHRNKIRAASASLGAANTVPALEAVISDHGKTPAAPLALLRLAGKHYEAGNYEAAQNKYNEFAAAYPDHQFVLGAEMGRIQCLEAKSQSVDALDAYGAFAAGHADSYLAPEAILGQGRCLRQLGRLQEARTLYEDFIAANPDSPWLSRAEEALAAVAKELEEVPDAALSPIAGLQPAAEQ